MSDKNIARVYVELNPIIKRQTSNS